MRRTRLQQIALFTLGVAIIILIGLHLMAQPAPDHLLWDNFDSTPLSIGHADDTGKGFWPGNTLPFLEGSAELGVDMLEMDIHMTSDNHIILIHDHKVDRTTDGTGFIWDMTLEEIEALEVGVNWTQDEGQTYPYRGAGLQVPTLETVFRTFPDTPMVIEMKQESPSLAEPFCQKIRLHDMSYKVLVASFSHQAITEFRAACPEVATSASGDEVRQFVYLNFVFLTGVIEPDYVAFQVPRKSSGIQITTSRFVRAAQRQGVQVQVWTINDPNAMEALLDIGVDAILTDRPDRLQALLDKQ